MRSPIDVGTAVRSPTGSTNIRSPQSPGHRGPGSFSTPPKQPARSSQLNDEAEHERVGSPPSPDNPRLVAGGSDGTSELWLDYRDAAEARDALLSTLERGGGGGALEGALLSDSEYRPWTRGIGEASARGRSRATPRDKTAETSSIQQHAPEGIKINMNAILGCPWADCVTAWEQQHMRFRIGSEVECNVGKWCPGVVAGLFSSADDGSLGDRGHGTFRPSAAYHVRLYSGQTISVRTDDDGRIREPRRQHAMPASLDASHRQLGGAGADCLGPDRRSSLNLPLPRPSPVLGELSLRPTMADVHKVLAEADSILHTLFYGTSTVP